MKNLTKIISVIITSVFLLASFSTGAFAGKKILFSIKGPGSGNPFWASVEKGAKEEAAKLGVDLVLVAPPQEGDVQAQINQVEDQLAKGVDAIALAPGDPNAFAPIVDDAIKSGVPVAMQALKDADMSNVVVVGFDATPDAATSILKGEMTATIAQFSYNMGAYGVKYALELANGGSIDPNIDTGTQLVTKENANDFK